MRVVLNVEFHELTSELLLIILRFICEVVEILVAEQGLC